MNKILSVICRILSIIIAVPNVLILTQLFAVIYMLIVGDVYPGDRMYSDIIAPSYTTTAILLFVILTLLLLAFFLSRQADKLIKKHEHTKHT